MCRSKGEAGWGAQVCMFACQNKKRKKNRGPLL